MAGSSLRYDRSPAMAGSSLRYDRGSGRKENSKRKNPKAKKEKGMTMELTIAAAAGVAAPQWRDLRFATTAAVAVKLQKMGSYLVMMNLPE